jgi:hypothetical protein
MGYRIPRLPKPVGFSDEDRTKPFYEKEEIDNYLKLLAATMQRDITRFKSYIINANVGNKTPDDVRGLLLSQNVIDVLEKYIEMLCVNQSNTIKKKRKENN